MIAHVNFAIAYIREFRDCLHEGRTQIPTAKPENHSSLIGNLEICEKVS